MTNKSVSNKYKNEGFGMQKSKDDLLGVSNELAKIFAKSLKGICTIVIFVSTINRKIDIVNRCIAIVDK